MARRYHLDSVFLKEGWASDVRVDVSNDGYIERIEVGGSERNAGDVPAANGEPERVDGIVVPGMPNAHSHAFQRGMAGNTEYRLSARDSFWTWRRAMYALANRITPAELEVLATQLFVEMLKSGYTSVAEFHYLHRQTNGDLYSGSNGLWEAIDVAAD